MVFGISIQNDSCKFILIFDIEKNAEYLGEKPIQFKI